MIAYQSDAIRFYVDFLQFEQKLGWNHEQVYRLIREAEAVVQASLNSLTGLTNMVFLQEAVPVICSTLGPMRLEMPKIGTNLVNLGFDERRAGKTIESNLITLLRGNYPQLKLARAADEPNYFFQLNEEVVAEKVS